MLSFWSFQGRVSEHWPFSEACKLFLSRLHFATLVEYHFLSIAYFPTHRNIWWRKCRQFWRGLYDFLARKLTSQMDFHSRAHTGSWTRICCQIGARDSKWPPRVTQTLARPSCPFLALSEPLPWFDAREPYFLKRGHSWCLLQSHSLLPLRATSSTRLLNRLDRHSKERQPRSNHCHIPSQRTDLRN